MSAAATLRKIPYFDYPAMFAADEAEVLEIVADVGRRGAFIMQRDLETFERDAAAYVGAKYALGVGNATDGLLLCMRAAGIGPGAEVIFCSHTMVATAAPIHFLGATPVPVECAADHLIDPESIAAAVSSRTRAIVPTHLNGRTCDMDALQRIADQHGLLIIEDAAQAFGARYRDRAAGTFGHSSAISFYPAKTLGCLGDGGLVLTNDDDTYRTMKLYRDHGRDESGDVVAWCLNSRLDNLQAAILNHKLRSYDEAIARRRQIARLYQSQLDDVPELRLPIGPDDDSERFDIFQNYEVEADRRDALKAYLAEHGVGTLIQWGGKAVHQFPELGLNVKLPYTEALFKRLLMLPLNPSLTDEDVAHIADRVRKFYGR
jgi:dTDP-4-amino-4,6-dideoxygalactose transaminase